MIETKTKVIDGLTFHTTQLPPLRAYPLSARVGTIVLPLFAQLGTSGLLKMQPEDVLKQDSAKLLPMLEPLLAALGKPENEDLPQKLLAGTVVELPDDSGEVSRISLASPEGINRAFQGRMFLMLKAMWFSVEVNFRDFFSGALKGAQVKASQATASA